MSRDALVIGINLYNELDPLEKPANDAEAIARLLETQGGFRVKRLPLNIEQSIDDKGVVSLDVLKKSITQLFLPQTKTNLPDTALLFFAGHGQRIEEATGIWKGYLASSDSVKHKHIYGFSLDLLKEILQKSEIKQQIVWLDCCFSGELLNFDEAALGNKEGYERCFIAASRDFEPAYESFSSKHGVLTKVLLQGLAAQQSVDNYDLADFIQTKLTSSVQKPLVRNFGRIMLTQAAMDMEKQPLSGKCPYKGLRFFDEDDAKYFHGREALTEQLIEAVRTSNFLAVLGVSGSGKSSVVRAGLLHQLRSGKHLGESRDWHLCKPFTPAQNEHKPLDNLAQVLIKEGLPPATRLKELESVQHFLAKGAAGFQQLLGTIDAPRVVLVIDQFEELFTRCNEQDREQFLACILGVLPAPNATVDKLCVVLTLRADFLGKCAEQDYSGLNTYLDAHRITVTPMTEVELSDAILKPAQAVGLEVEPELVTAMLQDVDADSLPLLEYSLWVLWEHRRVNRLTVEDYIRAGRVQGTLQQSADKAYSNLSTEEQTVAQWIFLGLTQLGEGTEDTRKQVFKQELVTGRYAAKAVDVVLDKLVAARLVVVDSWDSRGDDKTLVTVVDVAHEALIRHWGLLQQWLAVSRQDLMNKQDIERAAQEWEVHQQAKDYLLQAGKLVNAEEYMNTRDKIVPLTEMAKHFVTKSTSYRKAKRNRLVAAVLIVIMMLASFGFYANLKRLEAEEQTQVAFIEKSAAQSTLAAQLPNVSNGYYEHALLLAVQIFKDKDSTTTRSNLLRILQSQQQRKQFLYGHSSSVNGVAFSPDGKTLASASEDNTIRLWEVTTGQALGQPLSGHSSSVTSVTFSPDGKILASASGDNTIRLWEVATGQALDEPLSGHSHSVNSVAFSPDGKTLASASGDNTIRLWEVATGQVKILSGHSDWVNSVVFSPDGKTLASASGDNTIRLWEVATGQVKILIRGHFDWVNSVAFSPDGKTLASASGDNTIRLWEVATGQVKILSRHSDWVNSVVFSPDGKTLASASGDNTIGLWEVATGQVKILSGHSHSVNSVAFNPNGKTLASASEDRTIRLWESATGQAKTLSGHSDWVNSVAFSPDSKAVASASLDNTIKLWEVATGQAKTLSGHSNSVTNVVFSPDGKTLASASGDNTIRLWEMTTGQVKILSGHSDWVNSVAFSSDGKILASASGDKTIRLWEVATGQPLGQVLNGHSSSVNSVIFSPDDKILASASGDRIIRLWEVATGQAKILSGHSSSVNSVIFSPDGKILASASLDNTIRLWEVATGQAKTLSGHSNSVNSVMFSPDGKTLTSASDDRTIRLWEVATGQALGQPFSEHSGRVNSVAFSPDGKTLASGSQDNTVKLWDVNPESWAKKACAIVNRNFNYQEWQKYMGNRPHEKTCQTYPKTL